jgi:beta-lactamase regulating signal transducer with metallopeptidase domain
MIIWWIAQIALLGTLLAIAAFGAEAALRVARRQTRWVWASALLLTVTLAAFAPQRLTSAPATARQWQSAGTSNVAAPAAEISDVFTTLATLWRETQFSVDAQLRRGWSAWHALTPAHIDRWLLGAWGVLSIALLIAYVSVHVRYRRKRTRWPRSEMQGTSVRIADDIGPAVIGVTNAEIVVPQWLLTRNSVEQRMIVSHELEHVRVHDPLLLACAQLVVILLPWHPAVWWMAARLRLAVELDCDRRVLRHGASARAYGSLLIDLTDRRHGFGAALPAFSCSPSHLERRLVAMTPKTLRFPLVRALTTGAIASLALLAACEATLPTSQDVDQMTASTATAAAARTAMIDTANVRYFLNEVPVSKADADKIAAEDIASVNVTKAGNQPGGEVRIVLRNSVTVPFTSVTRADFTKADSGQVTLVTPTQRVTLMGDKQTIERTRERVVERTIDGTASAPAATARRAATGVVEERPVRAFAGLMIVDGVITDPAIANRIAPDQIVSVDVIKGPSATAQYSDPRAVNGVIKITTKKVKP